MKYKKGDKVIFSQGGEIGMVGTVMGNKGTSIAIAIEGFDYHDCEGLCPDNNGVYSPNFELEPYTFDGAMKALKNLREFHLSLKNTLSEKERYISKLEGKVDKLRELNNI